MNVYKCGILKHTYDFKTSIIGIMGYRGDKMIEHFDTIYTNNKGATSDDFKNLYKWLRAQNFPSQVIPEDYKTLISESNGGIFLYGEREYQFLSIEEVIEYYELYHFYEFMPFAYPFAMDGCGNFYIFNMRYEDVSVYAVCAGDMGWEEDEYFFVANTFIECLSQSKHWDE